MQRSIAIIGAGATCLAWLHFYIKSYKTLKNGAAPATIYIIEKRPIFGTGPAYEYDVSSNILNTKSGTVGPIHEKPGDFYRWLEDNKQYVKEAFPDFVIAEDSYAPRPLFGIYLQSVYKRLVVDAAAIGLRIVAINAEATDIVKHQGKYLITVDHNANIMAEYVFLLCGTMPMTKNALSDGADYIANPYPLSTLRNKVDMNHTVAIIGSRLNCIDTIIAMLENRHRGKITVFSPSGYFPSVRGTQGRIQAKVLTDKLMNELLSNGVRLTLSDIVSLFQQELESQGGNPATLVLPKPPEDIANFIDDEIKRSYHPRLWQAVLYATNSIISKLWSLLRDEDKDVFFNHYFSVFMAYRVSIPRENAIKILEAIKAGIVNFERGTFEIVKNQASGCSVKTGDGRSLYFDKMISAVGSPRDVTKIDSLLMNNLIRRDYVTANPYGGLNVSDETYEATDRQGKIVSGFYIVGELTNGVFFFTSALEINSYHVEKCCSHFVTSHCSCESEFEYANIS